LEGNYRVAREANFALHATAFIVGGHFLQGFVPSGSNLEFGAIGILWRGQRKTLFLDEHQFTVFDFEIFDVVRQFELIALLGKFFLQYSVNQ